MGHVRSAFDAGRTNLHASNPRAPVQFEDFFRQEYETLLGALFVMTGWLAEAKDLGSGRDGEGTGALGASQSDGLADRLLVPNRHEPQSKATASFVVGDASRD